MTPTYDVVIAGAGPVGLFLACELRLGGLSVLLLEQSETRHSPSKRLPFGMRGLTAPTVEAFYRRGMLDVVTVPANAKDAAGRSVERSAHWLQQRRRPAGHFAGIPFFEDRIDTERWPYRLPGPAGTSMAVTLDHLESLLDARAAALGVEVRRGCRLEHFEQSPSVVVVGAGGQTYRGRWIVGCDGGRSTVRKAGGFAFVGTDPEFTGYSVEVELAEPHALRPGRHYTPTGMYTFTPPGTVAMVEFDGGVFHRREPITLEHVQAVRCSRMPNCSCDRIHQQDGRCRSASAAKDGPRVHRRPRSTEPDPAATPRRNAQLCFACELHTTHTK